MALNRVFLGAIAVLALGAAGAAQDKSPPSSACPLGPAELKQLALRIKGDHPETVDFIRSLDKAVGADSAYLNEHSIVALSDEALGATLTFPYSAFRIALFEALRKRDPIDPIDVLPGVAISISPTRIDAPDIIKVVVERDGREVQPISNNIKPTDVQTRMGAHALLHSGVAVYPCSAFDVGGRVRVILIPERGTNIERELDASDLALFTTQQANILASALVNASSKDVESRIGKPIRIEGSRWTYEANGKRLFVYVNESGIVVDVDPKTFDLTTLRR